jgi:hypothetical protein
MLVALHCCMATAGDTVSCCMATAGDTVPCDGKHPLRVLHHQWAGGMMLEVLMLEVMDLFMGVRAVISVDSTKDTLSSDKR